MAAAIVKAASRGAPNYHRRHHGRPIWLRLRVSSSAHAVCVDISHRTKSAVWGHHHQVRLTVAHRSSSSPSRSICPAKPAGGRTEYSTRMHYSRGSRTKLAFADRNRYIARSGLRLGAGGGPARPGPILASAREADQSIASRTQGCARCVASLQQTVARHFGLDAYARKRWYVAYFDRRQPKAMLSL